MVVIDIPLLNQKDIFIGDGTTTSFDLSSDNPIDITVYISGLFLTEGEDYSINNNTVTFTEIPLENENINILYKA